MRQDNVVELLDAFHIPVVTAGSGTSLHRPSTEIVPGAACHNYGERWGRVVEYEVMIGFREWCKCEECQAYKEAIEGDVGKGELEQPRTELLRKVVAQGYGNPDRITSP